MSTGAVSGVAQCGLLAQLVSNNKTTQAQLDRLTLQASSGAIADTYGGLGSAAHVSISLQPQMAQVQAWQQNITIANGQLDTTQSVLSQLAGIASSFGADALGAGMQSATGAAALATQAQLALQQVVGLLNTQSDGSYSFAGTNSANAPIDSAALGTFTAAAATQVAELATGTDPTTLVGSLIADGATANFAYPGSSVPGTTPAVLQTPTGQGQAASTAFVAGINSYATQAGGGTTGSYVRDLITALAALAGLTSTTASESTLQSFGAGISQLLQGAGTAIATEKAGFGAVQSTLTTRSVNLSDTLTSLTKQISSVEDVDMTATATALAQVQTQLQASYKLIAEMPNLSLVGYL